MDSAQRRDWQTGLASGVRDEVVVNALLEDERTPNPRRRDNVIWATMVDFFLVSKESRPKGVRLILAVTAAEKPGNSYDFM